MKADLARKIPVNIRTVLFCLSASGAISVPLALLLQAIGYESPPLPGTEYLPLIAFVEILALPFVALSLMRLEPILTKLGLLIFLLWLLGAILVPAR